MKELSYYTTSKVPYPSIEVRKELELSKKYIINPEFVGTVAQIEAEKNRLNELYKDEIKQRQNDYYVERNQLMKEFEVDLIEKNGLTGHPKAALLYSKAWDMGHSDGLHSIIYHFEDLMELID